jgi:SAM-dependent methyltransferase
MPVSQRGQHEIAHGKKLSENNPEQTWGWGTPAGRIRAGRRARLISAAAGLRSGMRALEIGCGTGLFTEYFARSGAQIVALDISEELLAGARQRHLPETVTFVCSPFEALSADEPFDAVIGSSVLHHLDIESALGHIHRLLKPGGVMSFAEPNMLNPQIMIQKNIPWVKARLGDSPDETAFFRWRLAAQMRKIGFCDIEIIPLDWLHPAIPPGLIDFVQKAGGWFEKAPLLRELAGSLYIRGSRT